MFNGLFQNIKGNAKKLGDLFRPRLLSPVPDTSNLISPSISAAEVSNTPIPTATPQLSPEMFVRGGRIKDTREMRIPDVVHNAISKAITKYPVPSELMYDLGFAESSLDPFKKNPKGTATGLYQFTNDTWDTVKKYAKMKGTSLQLPNYDRNDPETNALAAAYLIHFGQLGRWDESRWNWGKYYKTPELHPYYAQTKERRPEYEY